MTFFLLLRNYEFHPWHTHTEFSHSKKTIHFHSHWINHELYILQIHQTHEENLSLYLVFITWWINWLRNVFYLSRHPLCRILYPKSFCVSVFSFTYIIAQHFKRKLQIQIIWVNIPKKKKKTLDLVFVFCISFS